ncbi:uncharacterized protein LOC117640798 isoform X3 [Thrips palmi]|uniref:Uncharacterized protein LOC117640798 isoform X3 n=1 Tax=Thrips palmi TaxID=161013 RepID=A0A6P8YA16_THRPL|nr:uncharacterized protein LOC117640798 isoform X3 [Thrips palmi]
MRRFAGPFAGPFGGPRRAFGELYSAWSGRVGASAYIPSEKVQQLFNDLQLYPSKLEVVEMLRCAQQRAQRTEPAFLTYEEFSLFAKELKRAAKGISWTSPLSLDRDGEDTKRSRTRRRTSTRSPQVFLGGSCNPTTWRQDVAIPLLQDLDITFYNPQVSDWAPELIEKEHFAKTNAEVLFFVIDNQTRNTASTVEVAFYSGLRKQKLVLVVHPYQSSGAKIAGEEILDDEWRDLISSQRVMQLLAERQGMPFFSNIRNAIDGIDKVLREKVPAQELQSGKKGLTQINESGVLEKEAKENVPVNFDQFSASVVDPKSNQESEHFLYNDTLGRNISSSRPLKSSSSNQQPSFDVCLCGDEVAVPLLKKHGLKYVIPPSKQTDWTKQMLQSNVTIADRSRVLLFIITDSSRALAELCLAAYYIGLDYKVVLYVGLLSEKSIINGKTLSNIAIKEYNRGRMYLRDLAVRQGVDVLDSVSAAVEVAARKCIKTSAAR